PDRLVAPSREDSAQRDRHRFDRARGLRSRKTALPKPAGAVRNCQPLAPTCAERKIACGAAVRGSLRPRTKRAQDVHAGPGKVVRQERVYLPDHGYADPWRAAGPPPGPVCMGAEAWRRTHVVDLSRL